jgi:tRNA (guanine37-N1)-methyltransferase
MAVIEACVRLIPGVLGAGESAVEESFEHGLLEYPQFTRPQIFEGEAIPPVLNSGDHAAVARWRKEAAERLTKQRRPDLWTLYEKRVLSARRPASSVKEPPDGG